jgi:dephospho-CoA kinase
MIQVQAEIEHQVEKLKSDPQANQVQAEIEHQVEELKSAPQANPDAIISNANKLADLAGRFDKEWEKICEDFKQTTGLDLLSSPSDPEQPQRSPDTPSSGRSSPTK